MNRREALRTPAAGSSAGVPVAGAVVFTVPAEAVVADPCLTFLRAWDDAYAAVECLPDGADADAQYDAQVRPFDTTSHEGKIPAATSAMGAAAALRKVLGFGDLEGQDKALICAALAYLEGGAA